MTTNGAMITDANSNEAWADAARQIRAIIGLDRDADELAQEALCLAWNMARSCAERGKPVPLKSFIHFGVRAARSGRKFTGDSAFDISRSTRPAGTPEGNLRVLGLSQWTHNATHNQALAAMIWAEGMTELTPRQRRIVDLLADGYRRIEIAEILGVSPATITAEMYTILAIVAG